jgi:phage terminase large subunit-like protein
MATSANSSVNRQDVSRSAKQTPARRRRPPARDYAGIATKYARDVVAGSIVACKWVKLACERHLRDLDRAATRDFPYVFDAELAARGCSFKEMLPHVRGKWMRPEPGKTNRIRLEPWQIFKNASIWGWVHRKTRLRRFRKAYISVARKNAKTTDAAGDALYLLTADDEPSPEVYCAANSLDQAMEVFKPARTMVEQLPDLRRAFSLEVNKLSIARLDDGGRFRPLTGIPRDGASPSGCILDEYHEAEASDQYDSNDNGMMSREQPLLEVITTAGTYVDGPCFNLEIEAKRILERMIENENFFAIIYTLDAGDDWRDLEKLKKANPNYGVSVIPEIFQSALREAIQQPAKQPEFITKNANVWRNSGRQWIPPEVWSACADPLLRIETFKGQPCYEGADLAAKIDLASRCRIFRRMVNGEAHYFLFWRHYVPENRALDGAHAHYQKWVHDKRMVAHPGSEIRLGLVQEEIERELKEYPRVCIAFDQWNAKQMEQALEEKLPEGVVIEIPQTAQFLSPAMVEVEAAAHAGRLHHDGDPVAGWSVSCVVVNELRNDNYFPDKLKNGRNKIDPVSAMLNAMNRAMVGEASKKSVYATRGLIAI